MRRVNNIFEHENYGGEKSTSVTVASIVCLLISILGVIGIAINFEQLTRRIAIFVADTLSSGFIILIVLGEIAFIIVKIKKKLRRNF